MANFNLPYITEKRYIALAPMLLTADGDSDGLITISSTYRIKVGQTLSFKSSAVAIRLAKVKRVISTTQFIVIDPKDPVTTINKLDMSDLLVADTATVQLSQEKRPVIELLEIQRQIYEEEPTVALRTHAVDWLGRSYSRSNPVPVELSEGSISIGTVNAELEVQLSHLDNVPDAGDVHDSVRIGDGVHTLKINNDGSVNITDNNSSLTVDGTVNVSNFPETQNVAVTSTVEVEIKNDSGNPLPVSGTVSAAQSGNWTVTVNQGTTPWITSGSGSGTGVGGNTDAFGRLRVSNPFTLFDSSFRYGDNTLKWNHVTTGSASVSHLINESTMALTVSASGDSVIRETKKVFSYQPGKSLLILSTFAMSSGVNMLQEVGYGGANDGIFFRRTNGLNYFVKRTSTSGTPVETLVPQSSWSISTLPELDPTKTQIFWTDIEWLGVGSVRCGFVIDGVFVHCHTFNHANTLTSVYMKTAILPIRYRIASTGSSGTMKQICSTVISEGCYVNTSQTSSIGNSLAGANLTTVDYRPLVAIRLKSTHLDAVAIPDLFDVYGLQQSAFKWRVVLNPTLPNSSWVSAGASSCIEYDISANSISGGTVIAEGIFVGSNKGGSISFKKDLTDFTLQLGRTIDGVSDIICLAAIATVNNDDAVGIITWQEHS